MAVIGIDQNARKYAIVVLASNPRSMVIEYPKKRETHRPTVLSHLLEGIHEFLGDYGSDDCLFIEAPLVGVGGVRTTMVQAQTQGIVLGMAHQHGLSAYDVHPSTWKKDVIGRGNASKDDVAEWLRVHHPVLHRLARGDQDLVDASCIALYGEQVVSLADRMGLAEGG